MYISKWQALVAAGSLQLAAGAAYTFSLYAPSLKETLQLSQPQLEGIGSALLSGGLFAWAPGFVYDALTSYHKFGPRLSGLIGVAFHFCGYFIIWIGASGHVHLPYWVLVASGLLASNSLLWLDTTAIVTCMRNFPNERGSVAGILKTFLGLSASILTTIYGSLFTPDGVTFLLFLAIGPPILALLVLPLLNHVPHMEENETKHGKKWLTTEALTKSMKHRLAEQRLLVVGGIVAVLLVYQLLTALAGQIWSLSPAAKIAIMCIALLMLVLALAAFVAKTGGIASKPARHPHLEDGQTGSPSFEENGGSERREASQRLLEDAENSGKSVLRQWNLPQCLLSFDYWVLWLSMYVGIGSGFTFLNNLGQQVEALGGAQGGQEVYVLLFATFNCLGRMICGFGSEWLLHRNAVPRTAVLLAMSASTTAVYLLIAVVGLRLLLPLAMVAGLVFGAHWALMPSCTSELFGAHHFAANQSIIHLAPAIGALTLSTELAGNLYQHQGRSHGDPKGSCNGSDCFRWTFLIIAALALVQTVLSFSLYRRSRILYKKVHQDLQHYQDEAQ